MCRFLLIRYGALIKIFTANHTMRENPLGFIVRKAKLLGPFSYCFNDTINFREDAASCIVPLFLEGNPFTVVLVVIFEWIFPLKGKSRFPTWKHVISEALKRGLPWLVNSYSLPSVILKTPLRWIVASCFHGFPFIINRMSAHSVCRSQKSTSNALCASAGFRFARCEAVASNDDYFSTHAPAFPHRVNCPGWFSPHACKSNNGEVSKNKPVKNLTFPAGRWYKQFSLHAKYPFVFGLGVGGSVELPQPRIFTI